MRSLYKDLPPAIQNRVKEVGSQLEAALSGDWQAQAWIKKEAFTTDDFPAVFQLINNVVIQNAFLTEGPGLWPKISQKVVRDNLKPGTFKTFDIDTSNLPDSEAGVIRHPGSLPHIPELGLYPAIGFTSSSSSIATSKVGARIAFSWEAFREDDYSVIQNLPQGLVVLARRTEDTQTFGVLLDINGWNQENFLTGSAGALNPYLKAHAAVVGGTGAIVDNNPLTRDALAGALAQAKQVPAPVNGAVRVNTVQKWALLVPAALVPTAEFILNATNIRILPAAGGAAYDVPNTLAGKFEIVEVPYIQTISRNSAYKDSMWGIVPLNGNGSERSTIVTTFLRGVETPELRIKADTGTSLAGGALDKWAGSFDNDSIEVRIRYFVDAWLTDRIGIVLSKGDSSAA